MNFHNDQDLIDALALSLSLLANIVARKEIYDELNVSAQVRFARALVRHVVNRGQAMQEAVAQS